MNHNRLGDALLHLADPPIRALFVGVRGDIVGQADNGTATSTRGFLLQKGTFGPAGINHGFPGSIASARPVGFDAASLSVRVSCEAPAPVC